MLMLPRHLRSLCGVPPAQRVAAALLFAMLGCSGSSTAPCDGGRCIDAARISDTAFDPDLSQLADLPDLATNDLPRSPVWTLKKSGTDFDLFGVWGSGPDDVYVCGGQGPKTGVMLHSKDHGNTWQMQNVGVIDPL